MISVELPSRGRPDSLIATVEQLLYLADDPAGVEILIAADPDDEPTIDAATRLAGARLWVAPERLGYKRICDYYNALDAMAAGPWSFMWNDDAHMLTPGWDQMILAEPPGVLWPRADYAAETNTFPVWPTAWTRHLGHVSLDQSTDMWICNLGRDLGVQRYIDVQIRHEHRHDQTGADRDAVADVATFHVPAMQAARAADAASLREKFSL